MELNKTYNKLIEDYKQFITVRNYKGGSKKYTPPVLEFLVWLEQRGITNIHKVKNEQMVIYYEYICNRPNKRLSGTLSDSSINSHLFAIRLFYENLLEQDVITKGMLIPSRTNKTKKDRKILTVPEIKELYKACTSQFEIALLSVAYGCGLRRNEIHHLNAVDIQFSRGMLIVKKGKGDKRREVPMSDTIIKDLRTYLIGERAEFLIRKNTRINAFFINQKGNRMSGGYFNDVLKMIITRANNYEIMDKEITLHCLRHSIATHLSEEGASMEFIRQFLGHQEIDTSQIYAKRRKRNNIFKL